MLLATDLDRTLLPNGSAPYDGSLSSLFQIITQQNMTLAYVSGMNLDLLNIACEKYDIPLPNRFIAEVGTVVYHLENSKLVRDNGWDNEIMSSSPHWNRESIVNATISLGDIELQEGWKQNPFKISYYLKAGGTDQKQLIEAMQTRLKDLQILTDIIYSFDPNANVGLVDILPKTATKASALEYVRRDLGLTTDDVIYCGDSGNDILPLTAGYKAIVVNNAPQEVKDTVRSTNEALGHANFYIANGSEGLNGNYSSGILEGLRYFGIIPN